MVSEAEAKQAIAAKRALKLKNVEDAVVGRMAEPWTDKLHDLVLYAQMNRLGIRITDIDLLIRRELARLIPDSKGK